MDKAIEIKRRAQRCIQNADLEGALAEYRKLIGAEDSDPYSFVLLADLLFKKGDSQEAAERYLEAARAYQTNGLYKNAIAVCKKMLRLSLKSTYVLERLGELHGLDGLTTEAHLYFAQHADLMLREGKPGEAIKSLRKAFESSGEDIRLLERVARIQDDQGDSRGAARTLLDAAGQYEKRGELDPAGRCRKAAHDLDPSVTEAAAAAPAAPAVPPSSLGPVEESPAAPPALAPGAPPMLPADRAEKNGEFEGLERFSQPPERGLRFGPVEAEEPLPLAPQEESAPEKAGAAQPIEDLLTSAQDAFRRGDRQGAVEALLEAAHAYEAFERWDDAATIYRNLGKGPKTPDDTLRLWFANCERRGARKEAAEVACELGDRLLGRGEDNEARAWFGQALALDDSCDHARRRIQRLSNLRAEPPSEGPGVVEVRAGRVEVSTGGKEALAFDLSAMLSEFERGITPQLTGDAQGQYDMAMTYREMGLLEQAVDSFRRAGADPAFGPRSAEMIGRCLLDQGRFEEAVDEFHAALALPNLSAESMAGLRFQLGLALEAGGQLGEALEQFQLVFTQQASYPDVALKIRVLRKALENV